MTDQGLLEGRQRIRPLMQRYNNYPWPLPPTPYFGPDERQALLGEIFGISLETIQKAPIEIEPPFYVDYVSLNLFITIVSGTSERSRDS